MIRKHINILSVALAAVLLPAGCSKKAPDPVVLAAPSPEIAVLGIDKVTLLWETVENAVSYQILLDGSTTIEAKGVCAVIGDLAAGTEYSVRMKSIAPEGSTEWLDSDYGEALTFKTRGRTVLKAPEVKVDELEPSSVKLSWAPVKMAGMYAYSFNGAAQQQTSECSLSFTGLDYNTGYVFKVKALPDEKSADVALESEWCELEFRTPERHILDAPVLAVSDINTNGFTVSWAEIARAGSYEYRIGGASPVSVSGLSAVLTGLAAATEYTVAVRALPAAADEGSYVASSWTEVKATTADLIALAAPVLKQDNVLATQFTVKWNAVEHAGSYVVSLNNGGFETVNDSSVTFTDLSTETSYLVKVKAVPAEPGTYKESPVSEITVTTKQGPSQDDKGGDLSDFNESIIF